MAPIKIYPLLLFFIAFGSCKKDNAPVAEKHYTAVTQSIVDKTDIIATVFSDTTFQVHPGVEETDIHYLNMQGLTTRAFILKIDLKNTNISLEAATPYDSPSYGAQTVTEMAKYVDAPHHRVMAGINGDFFNTSSYVPLGIVYKKGVAVKSAFSDNTDKPQQGLSFLGILSDGTAFIGDKDTDYPAVRSQLKEALGGGVFLVRDHRIVQQTIPTVDPRTAIGVTDDNVVYFIVVDGRNFYYSNGINYEQLAKLMYALNAKTAINVDGGGSSTFMIKHPLADIWQVRNMPSDGSPRAIANSWLVVSKTQP
ncbi:phosphodiester glycosidase family protein (plasmid) [Pedobacter sp. BS3]|uniref:phosphodiester glycosidase family protein n=1 Tax=Pedobacter sp. BS3 TaxID=2567937 RepID=UPI0011EED4AB|nr:phosphodiester glycosidase family protein [Pedobacter sp. BS3]TZF86289.1 phosphodiester glycosidase family protein [Pedobacter sp. BS3]